MKLQTTARLLIAACLVNGLVFIDAAAALDDPFGPAGNRSLAIDNFDGGVTTPGNDWPFAWWDLGQVYDSATIEFDLFMDNDPNKFWTYVDFRIGATGGGIPSGVLQDTAIYDNFRVQSGSGAFYFENASAPANGHPFTPQTAQHVKYTIDGAAKTYTVEVTPPGQLVERVSGQSANPWRSVFLINGGTGFDTVAFGAAFGPGNLTAAPFYIDNLRITSGGNTLLDETFDDDPVGGLPDTGSYIGTNNVGSSVEVVSYVPEPSSACGLLAVFCIRALRGRFRR